MQDGELRSARYYDEFSKRYDDRRGGREPGGYHDLLDDLEVGLVERYGRGRDILEVGCGTGLLLERFARFGRRARGIDLSEGMLERARARGLDVVQGSATELPFEDASFDVACSFKVLAHIPDVDKALAEMARVVRPGGYVVAEFYNPYSLRAFVKRAFGPREVGTRLDESAVFTRFDTPSQAVARAPAGTELEATRGIRIVTPAAAAMRVPGVRGVLRWAEHALADGPMARLAGFYVVVWRKR
ncbi:MAG: class I SAM-dependent methyltransferase [Polyangiaceae bacterium]|nr:class I SAM-dependent methyltransferase [Polyangiaceae bacterium]